MRISTLILILLLIAPASAETFVNPDGSSVQVPTGFVQLQPRGSEKNFEASWGDVDKHWNLTVTFRTYSGKAKWTPEEMFEYAYGGGKGVKKVKKVGTVGALKLVSKNKKIIDYRIYTQKGLYSLVFTTLDSPTKAFKVAASKVFRTFKPK